MGESGSGKTFSLRNCDAETTAICSPEKRTLPFRNRIEMLYGVTDSRQIIKWMKDMVAAGKKTIIIDDFQYMLAIPYMNRIKETGWDKYNDFGANYFDIIDVCKELPDDVIVYYMTHLETLDNGLTTVKLIGKLLREKITIEGLFTIVLRTSVSEGKYYFLTQNSGKDTVKSPVDMFPSYAIDNDLKYVDDKIRNYYYMDGAKTDEEMKSADAEAQTDVEKPSPGGRRQSRREKAAEKEMEKVNKALDKCEGDEVPYEEYANAIQQVEQEEAEMMGVEEPRTRRSRATEPVEEQSVEEEQPKPRTRRRRA